MPDQQQRRRSQLPLAIVLGSLLALGGLPFLTQSRIGALRSEVMEVAEPARALLAEIQLSLAHEMAGTREFLLTGSGRFAETHRDIRTMRQRAFQQLLPLARRLGPDIHSRATRLGASFADIDARLDSLYAGSISPQQYLQDLATQQARVSAATVAVAELQRSIRAISARRTADMEQTGRLAYFIASVLLLLAFTAALLVARFARSYRLLAEREQQARATFSAILDSITDAFYTVDRDWRFTYVNREAERLLRKPRNELLGRNLWDVFPHVVRSRFYEHYQLAMKERRTVEFEDFGPVLGIWVDVRVYPTPDGGIAMFFRDVSARREAEAERERLLENERRAREQAEHQREELERVTQSRTRLMRGFSHDVKNPLGAADGYLQLLQDGIPDPLTEGQQESVSKIRRSLRAALDLIDDLLEFARAERGDLAIEHAPADVGQAVRDAAEEFRAAAVAAGLELEVQLPTELPLIESDANRIRQVLSNLLSNAVKYTRQGSITVCAGIREDDVASAPPPAQNACPPRSGRTAPGPGRWIAIAVSDTGPGIPPEQQQLLFQEYTRLETSSGRRGTGIGLYISGQIARALGGEITVDSEPGKGSTFTLWLPLRPAAGAPH